MTHRVSGKDECMTKGARWFWIQWEERAGCQQAGCDSTRIMPMVVLSALASTQEIRANLPSQRSHRNEVLERHERHAHQLLLLQWPEARAVNKEAATAPGQQARQQERHW